MPSKSFRVALLLALLALAVHFLLTRAGLGPPNWDAPLIVAIYPYNADGSEEVTNYIEDLSDASYAPLAKFFQREAAKYPNTPNPPFYIYHGHELESAPAPPPYPANLLQRARWGLSVRWWHWRFLDNERDPDIIIVARYRSANENAAMLHSVGFGEFRLALARVVADERNGGRNQLTLAHEILHTVGASDLYELETGLPRHPEGYAEPDRQPRYPQQAAELMAGRIPVTRGRARQPNRLSSAVIGEYTAREIKWE